MKEVAGPGIIVDASNVGWYLYILSKCDFIDLNVVHLVRDSRAVAYSYRRKKLRKEYDGKEVYMPRHSSFTSTKHWVLNNSVPLLVRRSLPKGRYMMVRYEDFAQAPRKTLDDVLEMLGIKNADTAFFAKRGLITNTYC